MEVNGGKKTNGEKLIYMEINGDKWI